MRKYFRRFGLAAAAAVLGLGAVAYWAGGAQAQPAGIGITDNTAGVAGYYVNDNGHTRIRDVQADATVVPQIKFLNGPGGQGAVGVELCDPNSGFAAQLGVWWNAGLSRYQVVYATGTLNLALADPCIMTGLITPTPQQLLSTFTIGQGDHLHFEIFYNRLSHWLHFNTCDFTLDVCRQAAVHVGFRQFFEAGIGAVSNAQMLTAPANIFLDSLTSTRFNYYSSTRQWNSIYVPAHWQLKEARWVNASSQVVMSPDESLNAAGNAFSLFEGSTSP